METSSEWMEKHGIDPKHLTLWANIVLGWAGETGWQPSSWERAFLRLASVSDYSNQMILLDSWPEAMTAFICWKEGDLTELRRWAEQ